GVGVRRRAWLVARPAEGVHARLDVVACTQRADQLGDVHTSAAVDLRRVLLAQHVDPHAHETSVALTRASPQGASHEITPRGRPLCSRLRRDPEMNTIPSRKNVFAIVLAGGEGKRLMPLTADRGKPAVPFGGIYRLIDFALSNVVNSGYLKVVVLTQYKSHSLDRHVTHTWRMSTMLGNYVAPVPAQQRVGKHWYLGSADAIFQSLNLMHDEHPD